MDARGPKKESETARRVSGWLSFAARLGRREAGAEREGVEGPLARNVTFPGGTSELHAAFFGPHGYVSQSGTRTVAHLFKVIENIPFVWFQL